MSEEKVTQTPFGSSVDRTEEEQKQAAADAAAVAAAKAAEEEKSKTIGVSIYPPGPFEWPNPFKLNLQRVYRTPDGSTVVADIPKEVLALKLIEEREAKDGTIIPAHVNREPKVRELVAKGLVIDQQIDVWGWGGVQTMRLRQANGVPFVFAADGHNKILTPPLDVALSEEGESAAGTDLPSRGFTK